MPKPIPFLIEAKLDSPVIISPEAYLTLDSLLSASCQLNGDDDSNLPLLQTDGIYHASAGILVGNPITNEAAFISRMTNRDYADPRILPNKKNKLIIKTTAFPDKSRLDRYIAFHCPIIIWFGCGDPERTLLLLSKLSGLGKRCNSGYGQIGSLSILRISEDFSTKLPNESPARPIPISLCHKFGIDSSTYPLDRVTYRPNYFDFELNADLCVIPITRQISDADFTKIKEVA